MFNVNANIGSIKGYYGIQVYDENGDIVPEKTIEKTNNIITNQGLDRCVNFNTVPFYVASLVFRVGTGTNEIVATDTSLGADITPRTVSQSARTGSGSSYEISNNGDGTSTYLFNRTGAFQIGDFNGDILSEVGVAYSTGANDLVAGQLIKDGGGSPTTITVQSTEQLVINYSFEVTLPSDSMTAGSGTIDVDGTPVGYTVYVPRFWAGDDITVSNYGILPPNSYVKLHRLSDGLPIATEATGTRTFTKTADGAGTLANPEGIIPPGSGNSPAKYASFGQVNGNYSANPANPDWQRAFLVVEFDSEITKPSGFSVSLSASANVQMTRT